MSPSELDAFRRGDRALYRRLVECHSPRLLAIALAYTRDSDEAHDAVQEVWVRAYQGREQLENAGSFVGWLLTISRNVCHSRGRRAEVRARAATGVPDAAPGTRPAADAGAERAELKFVVAEAIAQLPPRQRDTVVLRILEARTTRETAALMGCAEGTVKASLHQALRNLNPILRSWRHVVVS